MAQIDLSNYANDLYPSSQGRAGTPDGNVFFDTSNGLIEFIGVAELATYIVTDATHPAYTDGSSPQGNPLSVQDGLKYEAIYAFENQERRKNEALREFDRFTAGNFKFGGAYSFINSNKPSSDADREIIRGSGWNEFATDGGVDRIYFGNKGLSIIEAGSQPYSQLSSSASPDLNTITPVDYAKVGQIDEAVQVFGDTGNVPTDASAGDFDTRAYEAVSVRTYTNNYDRKNTVDDLGITELGGYSTGFALNENLHLTTNDTDHPFADVWTTPAGVWTGVTLENLVSSYVTGSIFNEGTGTFKWVLNNSNTADLDDMVAYLDAASSVDVDIDSGAQTTTYGKRVGTWYSYNATGQVVTNSPFSGQGLYMYNVPVADQQRVIFTQDSGATRSYPFQVSVEAEVGSIAKGDANGWYHSFFAAAYNTSSAITVLDAGTGDVKGDASTADGNNKVIFAFDYTGDTVGGPADADKNCVFLCEGDGGATQAKTLYTITKVTTVAFACIPGVENNA